MSERKQNPDLERPVRHKPMYGVEVVHPDLIGNDPREPIIYPVRSGRDAAELELVRWISDGYEAYLVVGEWKRIPR